MKVITERDCILKVCERWRQQYEPFEKWGAEKLATYQALQLLNLATCSAQDVADVIGNSSWTELKCSECGQRTDWVLRVGEEPDYESQTACLCKQCARQVADIITNNP